MWIVFSGPISHVPRPPTTMTIAVTAATRLDAGQRDRRAEEEEREGVPDQVPEPVVQERRPQDPVEAVDLARRIPLRSRSNATDVDDLDDPHHRGEDDEQDQALVAAAARRCPVGSVMR